MNWMSSFKEKWSKGKRNTKLSDTMIVDLMKTPEVFRSLIENHLDAVCLFDFKGDIVTYNQRLSDMLGFLKPDIPPHIFSDIFHPFDFEQGSQGHAQVYDEEMVHQDGHRIDVQITHIPILTGHEVKSILSVIQNTSERVKTEKTIPDSITKLWDIVNNLDIAIWAVDIQKQQVVFCSDAFNDIYGRKVENFRIDSWKSFVHPDDIDEVVERQKKLYQGETIHHNYRIVTPEGTVKWIRDHTIPVKDSEGNLVQIIGFVVDASETHVLEQKLHKMAYYDELTGLPNRYYGRELIQQWIPKHQQENKTFALCYLNPDGLNRINDTFGHAVGDEVLREIAQRVIGVIHENDVVCRIGGDEFIVLMHQRNRLEDYRQTAQEVIDATGQSLKIEEYNIYVTVSIGMSIFMLDSNDYTSMARNARIAMKRAKALGKDNYQVYDTYMNIEALKLFQLEGDLLEALENDQLFMEYQPRVDIKTQKAVGAEALIRWRHPIWGIVSPTEFIPLAEEHSKILQRISQFVFKNVFKQIQDWQKEGIPFSFISINLSAKNFLKEDLVDRIEVCLNSFEIAPSLIEIEITENSLLQSIEVVDKQLDRLTKIGVRVALDDYGTGYSSISYLKKHPIHTIKLDRSFIQNIVGNEEDQVIVKSTINLTEGLKMNVVAEGVETREQFDLLKKYGCQEIQGYLFSKSVSAEEMAKLFLEKTIRLNSPGTMLSVERRRYYRINLPLSLVTEMTIISIDEKEIALGSTEVLILDIGLGGLQFMSHLRLMPNANIVYGFKTVLMGTEIKLSGKIVWDHEAKINIFEYGIEFLIEEADRDKLATLLNRLSLKLRSNPLFNDGQFITEDPLVYIKKMK